MFLHSLRMRFHERNRMQPFLQTIIQTDFKDFIIRGAFMRTTFLTVLFVISSAMYGQTFFAGLQMGYNHASASVTSNVKQDVSSYSAYLAGGLAELRFGGDFAVRIEPMYAEKGANMDAAYFDATYNHRVRLHCTDIPVLIQYKILDGPLAPVVFVGPNFSFITYANDSYILSKYGNVTIPGDTRTSQDLKDFSQAFDLTMEAGAGAEYALRESVLLFLNVRYDFGMRNLVKKDFYGISGTWKTSDLRILLGLKFRVF